MFVFILARMFSWRLSSELCKMYSYYKICNKIQQFYEVIYTIRLSCLKKLCQLQHQQYNKKLNYADDSSKIANNSPIVDSANISNLSEMEVCSKSEVGYDVVGYDDETAYFEKEVEEIFLRAVDEDVEEGNVIQEINSLRFAYNTTPLASADALIYWPMKLAFDTEHNSTSELYENWHNVTRGFTLCRLGASPLSVLILLNALSTFLSVFPMIYY